MNAKKTEILYMAMVQAVLLFGLEMWVMKLCIRSNLGGFYHCIAHQKTEVEGRGKNMEVLHYG